MDGNIIRGKKKDGKRGENRGMNLNTVYVCCFCVFDAFALQMMDLRPRRKGRKLAGRLKREGRGGERAVCEELRDTTWRVSLLMLMMLMAMICRAKEELLVKKPAGAG